MSKSKVVTNQAPLPIGPYSQGIRVGNLVFTAGQGGVDPVTQQIVEGGIAAQTAQTLENLKVIVEAAGTDLSRAVKTTVYLKNMDDFAAMNAVYGKYLGVEGTVPPARTTVEVARLPKDILVEIELIAEI